MKLTSSGAQIDWCISHPFDGSQPDQLPEGNPLLGICAACDKNGRGALYLKTIEAQERGISFPKLRRMMRRRSS